MKAIWQRVAALLWFAVWTFPAGTFAQSATTQPEIVRLTYVEGDVRLSTGGGTKGAVGQAWVQAQAGVPMEPGFNLATGIGRAEIEFEDGSLLYLADNSALLFEQLIVNGDAPLTVLELLSGTATIDARPLTNGSFRLETPGDDSVIVTSPEEAFLRVASFLDGMTVTLERDTTATHNGQNKTELVAGQTLTYKGPDLVSVTKAADVKGPDEWDQWVNARLNARQATMTEALKASGLSEPIPGLEELYQSGNFFPCAPYGTCWQPNESVQTPPTGSAQTAPQGAPQSSPQSSGQAPSKVAKPQLLVQVEYRPTLSPCMSTKIIRVWDERERKWVEHEFTEQYWDWALCRAGSWIYRSPNYVLVLRKKKHHHPPICWVRAGNKTGFVPRSPRDEKGKPPFNLKYGLFVPTGRADHSVERVPADPSKEVKLLSSGPKEFRDFTSSLPQAQRPEIRSGLVADASMLARPAGSDSKNGNRAINRRCPGGPDRGDGHTFIRPTVRGGSRSVL